MRSGAVSDSVACFWRPFPSTEVPYPALIQEEVPSLSATRCAWLANTHGRLSAFEEKE